MIVYYTIIIYHILSLYFVCYYLSIYLSVLSEYKSQSILSSNANLTNGPAALENGISHHWDQRPFIQILLAMVFDWDR